MDDYLVYFDDEQIPHKEIKIPTDYDIKVVAKEEPKIDLAEQDDILEKYEDHMDQSKEHMNQSKEHMDHVNKLFSKLKKTNQDILEEKKEIIKKLENIKTKYPHVNCQKISVNDDIDTIKKTYNNFRFDVIKHLGKEIEKENHEVDNITKLTDGVFTAVISNLGLNSIITNPSNTTHIIVSDLLNIINKAFGSDENELMTASEFLKEKNLKAENKKHKDIEDISSKIIELNKIIKNKINNNKNEVKNGAFGGTQCTLPEENEVNKLTKKLNQIIGIDTVVHDNSDDDSCTHSNEETNALSSDSDSYCQFTDNEKKNN